MREILIKILFDKFKFKVNEKFSMNKHETNQNIFKLNIQTLQFIYYINFK